MTRNAPPRAGARAGRPVSGRGLPATLALLMFLLAVPAPADAQSGAADDDGGASQARIRRGILTLAPSLEIDRIGIETTSSIAPTRSRISSSPSGPVSTRRSR